jgi:transposase
MIHPSFIPPRPLRELRDVTRRRERLNGAGSAEKNRVQKVLEDANVKLGNVLTDVFGVSGQLMLDALLKGEAKSEEIAQFARKRAKKKIPEIIAALEGHQMNEHHRKMIRYSLSHMKFIEEQITEIDQDIAAKIQEGGLDRQWQILQTVPGVQQCSAAKILAETGADMTQFPSQGTSVPGRASAPETTGALGRIEATARQEVIAGCAAP